MFSYCTIDVKKELFRNYCSSLYRCSSWSDNFIDQSIVYIRSNKLLRMFNYCTIDVKKELFRNYCSSLYCCSSWSDYRKATYRKLIVSFNNIPRLMLGLPWRCSYDLLNIGTVIRRSLFGFIQRLSVSQNSIVRSIELSWFVRIELWDFWTKTLYL